jgi:hypothetical protein
MRLLMPFAALAATVALPAAAAEIRSDQAAFRGLYK